MTEPNEFENRMSAFFNRNNVPEESRPYIMSMAMKSAAMVEELSKSIMMLATLVKVLGPQRVAEKEFPLMSDQLKNGLKHLWIDKNLRNEICFVVKDGPAPKDAPKEPKLTIAED